jgi:hypothetical protein
LSSKCNTLMHPLLNLINEEHPVVGPPMRLIRLA